MSDCLDERLCCDEEKKGYVGGSSSIAIYYSASTVHTLRGYEVPIHSHLADVKTFDKRPARPPPCNVFQRVGVVVPCPPFLSTASWSLRSRA